MAAVWAPDEVGISEAVARRWRLRPGGTLRLRAVTIDQVEPLLTGEEVVPAGPTLALRVAAVERLPDDVAVGDGGVGGAANAGFISLTPAFHRTHKDTVASFPPSLRVRLERGQADAAAFAVAIRRLTGGNREVTVIHRPDLTGWWSSACWRRCCWSSGRVAVTAWRLAEERPYRPGITGATGTTSTLADTAARAGLPPTSVAGSRMALEQGRGPRAVPVRVSLVGVTVGIIALTAAITFGASLDRLLGTPRLYGWDFDAATGAWQLDDPATSRPAWLAANPQVGAWSAVWASDIQVNGTVVGGAGFDTAGGRVFPTLVEGREPSGPDELVLGAATLRRLGLRLGQTVRVEAGRPAAMRIVGTSALVRADSETAGDGAILTIEGLRRLKPDADSGYGMFYVRLAPGADPEVARQSLRRLPSGVVQVVQAPQPPPQIDNLGRVGALPDVLAGLLALLAASALAHLLVTSVRRRRHDLAILKALGFVRRQVSAAVAWEATTVALVALAVGLPLGVALGRWTWSLLVDRIGLGAPPVTPGPALLAGVAGTVLVANLVAAWPGRVAARTRPAVALRSE